MVWVTMIQLIHKENSMKKYIQVFLDAKTTTDKTLISVACIAEDSQEFYAEICDTTEARLAARLKEWIDQLSQLSGHDKEIYPRVILNVYGGKYKSFSWSIRKFFDNYGGSPNGLNHVHEIKYPDNYRTRLFLDEKEYARRKIENLNLPHTLESARSLLAAWQKVETCKETKEVFDGENWSVARTVVHKKNEDFGMGFCKLCSNLTEEYDYKNKTSFFFVPSSTSLTKQEDELLLNSTENIKQEAVGILEKLICAKDNAKTFGDLIVSNLISNNLGDFDYDLLYSPGITAPEIQTQLLKQIEFNLQAEKYRKLCEENDPFWQYFRKKSAEFRSNAEIRSKQSNENKPILTAEQQDLYSRDAIERMRAHIKSANSSSKNIEQNKEGKLLPGRKLYFSENTNSLKRSPKKLSAVFCSEHNPWGSKESRRNYKNDSRRLNEFNREFERLVRQKLENKICNVHLKKLFNDEYKDWKSVILDKFNPEKSYRYDRRYGYSIDYFDYVGEVFGLKKLRREAYLNVTKSTLEKIEELQGKGISNQSEIARLLGLKSRTVVSTALARKKQNTKESV